MIRIDNLISHLRGYLPPGTDLEPVERAYVYSAQLHRDRFSASGAPTLQHALEVGHILADLRLDLRSVIAGLLHDALLEGLAKPEELAAMVGEDIAQVVAEVSRLGQASFHGTEAARADHMRQMILASTRDIRVILILLADRLQMLRQPGQLDDAQRNAMARETMAIYAPIAHRLGIHSLKDELEDRAFATLEPAAYDALQRLVDDKVAERSVRIDTINMELTQLLTDQGMEGEVLGRTKHLYSIHNKMQSQRLDLSQIYDLLATRVVVASTEDCYRVLGLVHAAYTPLPGRFKDYVALPKDNGYKSLHTLVFGHTGDMFEIQIRSREMHRQAEMGVASHFSYKDGSNPDNKELASVNWFRGLLENLAEGQDPAESMELLSRDLVPDHMFMFTPKGEVIKLPTGATPIDFAYAVHSDVGHRCTGARINGRMISIRTPLQNGSVVEILTAGRQEPKEDWLKSAVTSKARGHIRAFLRRKEKHQAIEQGREQVARAAKGVSRKLDELFTLEPVREWMQRHALNSVDDVYAAEGFGKIRMAAVLERLFPPPEGTASTPASKGAPFGMEAKAPPGARAAKPTRKSTKSTRSKTAQPRSVISVAGLDNVLMRFAKCCAPVHGDPVVGIITQGRGVSVHHRNCHNMARLVYHEDRLIEVDWVDDTPREGPVTLAISGRKSMKELLALITLLEDEEKTHITSGHIASKGGRYTQHLTLKVDDARHLERILQRLNAMEGILAERVLDSA